MRCSKCGRDVPTNALACPACSSAPALISLAPDEATEKVPAFRGDAVILGALGGQFASFVSDRTERFFLGPRTSRQEPSSGASVYVDDGLQAMLRPDVVLEVIPGAPTVALQLSDAERAVLAHVDGQLPLGRVLARCELTTDELCLAVGLLVDKGVLRERAAAPAPAAPGGDLDDPTEVVDQPPRGASPTPSLAEMQAAPVLRHLVGERFRAAGTSPAARVSTQDAHDTLLGPDTRSGADTQPGPAAHASDRPSSPGRPARDPRAQAVALFDLAEDEERQGRHDEAARLLREALRLRPDEAAIHNRLGVLLAARQKDYAAAREALARAVELKPENAVYRGNLGKVLAALERGAGPSFDRARRSPTGDSRG